MNKNLRSAAFYMTVIVSTFFGASAFAQQTEAIQLINIDRSAKVQDVQHTNAHFLNIDTQVFESGVLQAGSEFWVETSPGNSLKMKVSKAREYYPGVYSYVANVPGENTKQFIFTYSENRLNGIYHESHKSALYFNWDTKQQKNFLTNTPNEGEQNFVCDVLHDEGSSSFFNQNTAAKASYKSNNANSYSPAAPLTAVDDSITIDLLLLYTDKAETWAQTSQFGNITTLLAQAITQAQAALDNSKTSIGLRIVHTYKTDYDDDGSSTTAEDHLRRLTQSPENPDFGGAFSGYMEEVHVKRDSVGADLVAAIMSEPNTGGIAWRLNSSGGSPTRGFSVNRVQQGTGLGLTIIHEIGHNMGSSHSRTQSQNAADGGGGLFHYSTGYQDFTNGFATTMAYSEQGVSRVPIFSSPDLSWDGVPAGTNNIQTPQNSARSLREIKRTISFYRPTIKDTPQPNTSSDVINVNMNREDELEVVVDISNDGVSPLVWDVDFTFPENSVAKASSNRSSDRIEPVKEMLNQRPPANYSRPTTSKKMKSANNETVLYETSFEGNEGFARGSFSGLSEWRDSGGSKFMISNNNARTGSQHLRLEAATDGETQYVSSPFFGYQTFGTYELSLDFSIGGTQPADELFDYYVYDSKTGSFSAGVIIANNTIYTADLNEEGGLSFIGGSIAINPDVYYKLRIVMDAEEELIKYFINNQQVAATQYIGDYTPGLLRVLHRNEAMGAHMDVDNIEIKRVASPYSWLSIADEDLGGVTQSGESSSVSMTFNTAGMSAGVYETIMTIKTNSPDQPMIEIPVTLEVNQEVSNETASIPDKFTLSQNYPNPFNPTTNIRYTLESSQKVELTIYNMQGQKVTTLQNGVQSAGSHTVTFNASNLASGVYMYQLKAGTESLTRQMVLIK